MLVSFVESCLLLAWFSYKMFSLLLILPTVITQ